MNKVTLDFFTGPAYEVPAKHSCCYKHMLVYAVKDDRLTYTVIPYSMYSKFTEGVKIKIHITSSINKRVFFKASKDELVRFKTSNRRKNFKYIWEEDTNDRKE